MADDAVGRIGHNDVEERLLAEMVGIGHRPEKDREVRLAQDGGMGRHIGIGPIVAEQVIVVRVIGQ